MGGNRKVGRARGIGGGGGGGLVSLNNWNTGTGNTSSVLRDSADATPFDTLIECGGGYTSVMNVVDAAGAGLTGWPSTNAMRLTARGPTLCGNVQWDNNSPLAESQSHYGRLYFRIEEGFLNNHGLAYNCCGTIQIVPIAFNSVDGTVIAGGGTLSNSVLPNFKPSRNGAGTPLAYPYYSWGPGIEGGLGDRFLAVDTLFRYEWYLEYVTATTVRLYPRIYDSAGTLLYDVNTFYPVNANPATESLQDYYNAGNTFGVTDTDLARQFSVGHEGPGGSVDTGAHLFIGALAFSITDWIGA